MRLALDFVGLALTLLVTLEEPAPLGVALTRGAEGEPTKDIGDPLETDGLESLMAKVLIAEPTEAASETTWASCFAKS